MDIPNLVRQRLGEEGVEATVSLGDEDLVCLTPTRTLVYRSEGLLSDESIEVYSHDVQRLRMSEGRRKTKFVMEYVDGTESFSVPSGRADTVLSLLVSGILAVAEITEPEESVAGVFRFSELTLVVTETRLVKHVGASVFDEDYEEYSYEDVTGLAFEEGRVATQIVLTVGDRPQRIKAPSDDAKHIRQTLEQALLAFYEVDSLSELNDQLEENGGEGEDAVDERQSLSLGDSDISPLVAEDPPAESASADPDPSPANTGASNGVDTISTGTTAAESANPTGTESVDPAEFEAMNDQLSQLTEAVSRQNDLLRAQQETIEQLIEELRRGR